jgi:hypothetical protein
MTLLHSVNVAKAEGRIPGLQCPVCDQPIPTEKADQARSRLEAREREVSEAVGIRLKEQFSREREQVESSMRAELERVQRESALALATAASETLDREIAARDQGAATARNEIQHLLDQAESEKAVALRQYEALQAQQESIVANRVEAMREKMELAGIDTINSIRVQYFEEKQRLTNRLEELARQLDKKSADERGEGAEVDLFEALREEFPRDGVTRVAKGSPGPDIVHDVFHNDRLCGRIIYDCKDRISWRNEYSLKLRADQMAAAADHAILSTRVFPAGARQLCELDGVLIANPARVVALVHMLRRHLVQLSTLRLADEQREGKTSELYDFIRSETCARMFDTMDSHAADLLRLQEKERRGHEIVWKRQQALYRTLRKTSADMRSEIDRIIEAPT